MTTGTVSLLLSPGSASQQGPTRPVRMFTVSAAVLVPFAIPPLVRFTATDFIKFRSRSPAPLHDVKRRRGRPSVFLQRQKKNRLAGKWLVHWKLPLGKSEEERKLAETLGGPAGKRLGSAFPRFRGRTELLMPRLCWRQRNRPSADAADQGKGEKKEGDLKKIEEKIRQFAWGWRRTWPGVVDWFWSVHSVEVCSLYKLV